MGLRRAQEKHRYQLCDDEYCELFPCRVYKEGYRNGYEDGYGDGTAQGFADGFAEASRPAPAARRGVSHDRVPDRVRLAAAWVLSLLVQPFGRCRLCRGGRVRSQGPRRPASAGCARAHGRRQRPGSRTVHRIRRQVALAGGAGEAEHVRGTWQTTDSGGGGGLVLAVIAAAVLLGSGAASAIASALVTIVIIAAVVLVLAVAGVIACSCTGRARIAQDGRSRPGRYTSYPPKCGRNWRNPPIRPSARAARSTCT